MKLFYFAFFIHHALADHQERYHCDSELIQQGGLFIKPSETGLPKTPPKIPVGNHGEGGEFPPYDTDLDHIVVPGTGSGLLQVYLPGTTDSPELSSCLINSIAKTGLNTIGLSHAFLSSGDKFRNAKCARFESTEEVVNCLEEQHKDGIFGGDYGARYGYWLEVDYQDSIVGRLVFLLEYLTVNYPESDFGQFLTYGPKTKLQWSKIQFIGHSQGAGHAAYLAQINKLYGAILLSGPQDDCIDCPADTKYWIDYPYKTKSITGFAHGNETFFDLIADNWVRMAKAAHFSTWGKDLEPTDVQDIGDGHNQTFNVCDVPLKTYVEPLNTSLCGDPEHCSTSLDDSTPFQSNDGGELPLYDLIWRELALVAVKC